jgi:hypothetical protein
VKTDEEDLTTESLRAQRRVFVFREVPKNKNVLRSRPKSKRINDRIERTSFSPIGISGEAENILLSVSSEPLW